MTKSGLDSYVLSNMSKYTTLNESRANRISGIIWRVYEFDLVTKSDAECHILIDEIMNNIFDN
jgi:hypothetical protein